MANAQVLPARQMHASMNRLLQEGRAVDEYAGLRLWPGSVSCPALAFLVHIPEQREGSPLQVLVFISWQVGRHACQSQLGLQGHLSYIQCRITAWKLRTFQRAIPTLKPLTTTSFTGVAEGLSSQFVMIKLDTSDTSLLNQLKALIVIHSCSHLNRTRQKLWRPPPPTLRTWFHFISVQRLWEIKLGKQLEVACLAKLFAPFLWDSPLSMLFFPVCARCFFTCLNESAGRGECREIARVSGDTFRVRYTAFCITI